MRVDGDECRRSDAGVDSIHMKRSRRQVMMTLEERLVRSDMNAGMGDEIRCG